MVNPKRTLKRAIKRKELELNQVSVVTQTEDGPIEIGGLKLLFDASGIRIEKSSGQPVRFFVWDEVKSLTPTPTHIGKNVPKNLSLPIELSTQNKSHHFLCTGYPQKQLIRTLSFFKKQFLADSPPGFLLPPPGSPLGASVSPSFESSSSVSTSLMELGIPAEQSIPAEQKGAHEAKQSSPSLLLLLLLVFIVVVVFIVLVITKTVVL
ncbi:MAG: hypothetical protein M1483_06765 [Actinobacteria bacterium]|nr:hypothetical protein [Actinomycetota bacterium]MCL6105309.1 hypothetical protein [Actinomycetota bacterium]